MKTKKNNNSRRDLRAHERDVLFHFMDQLTEIPKSEFDEFQRRVFVEDFKKGQFFTRIGDPNLNIGFVLQGGFSVSYTTLHGKSLIRNFCIEMMPVGSYASMLSNQPAHVEIEAFEDSVVAAINYKDFVTFYERHGAWERFGRKIAEQHYISRERREYQLLALDAEGRYNVFLKDFPGLVDRVTQASIASYIGITPVALSRIVNRHKN